MDYCTCNLIDLIINIMIIHGSGLFRVWTFGRPMLFGLSIKSIIEQLLMLLMMIMIIFGMHLRCLLVQMKGSKVQTLGARAVAGAWCMASWLVAWAIIIIMPWVKLLIRMRTAN